MRPPVCRLTGDHGADHILKLVSGAHPGKAVQTATGGRIYQSGMSEGFQIAPRSVR